MKRLLILGLLAIPSLCFAESFNFTGKVVGVKDGDTVVVLHDSEEGGPRPRTIRLYGVDCPEKRQSFGSTAKQFTSDAIFGKEVKVAISTRDRYLRDIGIITMSDGKILNQELLRSGMCWNYKQYSKSPHYRMLESTAREKKLGVWSESNPTPPWLFRKNK